MYVIEISDSKIDKMSEYVEDMLWAGGELMHCLEKMKGESGYGHRDDEAMGYRSGRSYSRSIMVAMVRDIAIWAIKMMTSGKTKR